jgi:hypothetical protein
MLVVGSAATATDDLDRTTEPEQVETAQGAPIDRGHVILNGQYLPPPYVVGRRGDDLLINEQLVAKDWLGQRLRRWSRQPRIDPDEEPTAEREASPEKSCRRQDKRMARKLARVEAWLCDGGMLIFADDERIRCVDGDMALVVLDILLSDAASEDKVASLLAEGVAGIRPRQWTRIVESLEPTSDGIEEETSPMAETDGVAEENPARREQVLLAEVFRSEPVRYGFTVLAMGLGVIALGSLLTYRPQGRARWRDVDTSGEGVPLVVRSVVLLALLGLFDLALTVAAQQTGGFLELNPLGSRLQDPALLAAFKITTLLGACLILLALRRYRAAQIAAWWLCLICTIVTFRWLTYNAMFFA